jgi:hypothetical protein
MGCASIVPRRNNDYLAPAPPEGARRNSSSEALELCLPFGDKYDALHARGQLGCSIERTEERGITIAQLVALFDLASTLCSSEGWTSTDPSRLGQTLTPDEITLYDIMTRLVKPATTAKRCSYVELVATSAQRPKWFVSHWWGESVGSFIKCLQQHSIDRGLRADCAYWVCAYAINQHTVSEELGGGDKHGADGVESFDVERTPFYLAMSLCDGTVSVLDDGGLVFTRVWCGFELHVSIVMKQGRYLHDVYTVLRGAQGDLAAVGLVDGFASSDMGRILQKSEREAPFPPPLVERACSFAIKDAVASFEQDKVAILRFVGPAQDELNATVRSRFGLMLIARLLLAPKGSADERMLELTLSELRLCALHKLVVTCSDAVDVSPARAALLMASIPPSIEELRVHNGGAAFADSAVLVALGSPQMHTLQLTCALGDAGMGRVCDTLRGASTAFSALRTLVLHKNRFADEGARSLARLLCVNTSLTAIDIGVNQIGNGGADSLARSLQTNSTLLSLHIHCNLRITDDGRARFLDGLRLNRAIVHLYMHEHRGPNDAFAVAVGHLLPVNSSLRTLFLSDSDLKPPHLQLMAPALKASSTLLCLILKDNALTDEAAPCLADILALNRSLTRVDLSNCRLTDASAAALAAALDAAVRPLALTTLDLRGNALSELGKRVLLAAWQRSHPEPLCEDDVCALRASRGAVDVIKPDPSQLQLLV